MNFTKDQLFIVPTLNYYMRTTFFPSNDEEDTPVALFYLTILIKAPGYYTLNTAI